MSRLGRKPVPSRGADARLEAQSTAVAEILSKASVLTTAGELEEVTEGLLAMRARRLAPAASDNETRLLVVINEGVPVELRDRIAALIQKRDQSTLTAAERRELLRLADDIERRGLERAEALSKLAELRGLALPELMSSLGISTANRG